MDIVEYKGFELVPVPYQFAETSEWAVRVTITRHHDARGQSLEKTCIAPGTEWILWSKRNT
jgi:hypothetical protein